MPPESPYFPFSSGRRICHRLCRRRRSSATCRDSGKTTKLGGAFLVEGATGFERAAGALQRHITGNEVHGIDPSFDFVPLRSFYFLHRHSKRSEGFLSLRTPLHSLLVDYSFARVGVSKQGNSHLNWEMRRCVSIEEEAGRIVSFNYLKTGGNSWRILGQDH